MTNKPEPPAPTTLNDLLPGLLAMGTEDVMTPVPSTLRSTMDYLMWTDDAEQRFTRLRAEGMTPQEAQSAVAEVIVESAKGAGKHMASRFESWEFVRHTHAILATKALAESDAVLRAYTGSLDATNFEVRLLNTFIVPIYEGQSGFLYERLAQLLHGVWRLQANLNSPGQGIR
ncbi:hypothetical protein ACWG8W_06250 [Citricoccus zhacaiensis]